MNRLKTEITLVNITNNGFSGRHNRTDLMLGL
jgi:hypothetical protein